MEDDVDLEDAAGPPGIPRLNRPEDDEQTEERRRKNAAKRKRQQRRGKRPTVRIPDDAVVVTESRQPATPPSTGENIDVDDASDAADFGEEPALSEKSSESESPAAPNALPELLEVSDEPNEHLDGVDDLDEPTRESFDPEPTLPRAPSATATEQLHRTPLAVTMDVPAPRPSAPVMVDESAVLLMRPMELLNDMPAVPSARGRAAAAAFDEDDFEEVEPERMSLPGDVLTPQRRAELKPPPLPPARAGGTAPAPPSSPSTVTPPAVSDPRLAIPGPLPVPLAPPSRPTATTEPPPRGDDRPTRSLPKPPPPTTEFTTGRPKEKRPWWSEMFEDDFVRTLDNPKLRDIERDVAFIEQSLRVPQGARVLDLACGNGAHAVELAARGYYVTGLDLSTTMLDMAGGYNTRRGQSVQFLQADFRQLDVEGTFDAIYMWGGSFGYFDDASNANVIERVVRALKPGGRFLIDLTNRDFVAPRSPSTAWFEKPGCVCMDEVRYDYLSSRLYAKRMVIFESGRAREIEYSVRLYTANELGILLESRGLRVKEVSGHRATRGAYFGNESPQLIVLAEKA